MTNQAGGKVDLVQRGERLTAPLPVHLSLPMPPSVNAMFRNVRGGRVKSKLYQDWIGHAGWQLRLQNPAHLDGHVVLIMSAERTSDAADIDNRVKATLDLLVAHRVIEDDRFVVGFCIAWAPPANRVMRLVVLPAASMDFRFQLAPDGAHGGWYLNASQEDDDNGNFAIDDEASVG